MRAVLQRVRRAQVSVGDRVVSSIDRGICVLVGIHANDKDEDMQYMIRKILNCRVFEDDNGKLWSKSVMELGFDVLSVSQFTLYGTVNKGSKPDFHASMKSTESKEFYEKFLAGLRAAYKPEKIHDGEFGALMLVDIVNDGPVTLELDSRKFVYVDEQK